MKLPLGKIARFALEWIIIPAITRAVSKDKVAKESPNLSNNASKPAQIQTVKDLIAKEIQTKVTEAIVRKL